MNNTLTLIRLNLNKHHPLAIHTRAHLAQPQHQHLNAALEPVPEVTLMRVLYPLAAVLVATLTLQPGQDHTEHATPLSAFKCGNLKYLALLLYNLSQA